jgi:hypothetical protein
MPEQTPTTGKVAKVPLGKHQEIELARKRLTWDFLRYLSQKL